MASVELTAAPAEPVDTRPWWRRAVIEYAAACLITLVCLVFVLRLWQADLRVPVHYSGAGDVLSQSALVKGMLDNGWVLSNPRLGAPFGLRWEDYPLSDNLHFLIMKALSLLVSDWAVVLNLFFLLSFPLITATSLFAIRMLKVSTGPAIVASVLYAFLPFHFMRGQAHLLLGSYYLVPLICVVLLWITSGRTVFERQAAGSWAARLGLGRHEGIFGLIVCILAGAAGIYYAFFACVLLVVAGGIGAITTKSLRKFGAPAVLVIVIVVSGIVNISPSIMYAARHGRNAAAVVRTFGDAELYSLKITQLVLPVTGHRVPILDRIKNQYNAILGSSVNENDTASLGIVGALGFCALLAWVFLAGRQRGGALAFLGAASQLNLAAVLFATTSGFGALASIAVFRQIRAHNRISVYVAFLSLFALAVILQQIRTRLAKGDWQRWLYTVCLAVLLLVGIADQTTAYFVPLYAYNSAQFRDEDDFVRRVESAVPPNSMVFQLPYVPFPEYPPVHRMTDYDHLRPYLHSKTLRWSYGAIKGRAGDAWLRYAGEQAAASLPEFLALAGYAGVYIDRFGYADSAAGLEKELARVAAPVILSSSGRFAFYNLTGFSSEFRSRLGLDEWAHRRERILHPVLVEWAEGCTEFEGTVDANWRWCSGQAHLTISNLSERPRRIAVTANFSTGHAEPARVGVHAPGFSQHITATVNGAPFSVMMTVPPGRSSLRFDCDARPLVVPGDPRLLVFRVNNLGIHESPE